MIQVTLKIDRRDKSIHFAPIVVVVVDQTFPDSVEAVKLVEDVRLKDEVWVAVFVVAKAPIFGGHNADVGILLEPHNIVMGNGKHGNVTDASPGSIDFGTWVQPEDVVWIGLVGCRRVVNLLVDQGNLDHVVYWG